jgi:hypothetical protein
MYENEAHPQVLVIIEHNVRLASLIEKEPRLLHLLNVAASQSSARVISNRWEAYESFKKTYAKILQSSGLRTDRLLHEYHEAFVTAVDELLPVLSARKVLELEFAEPLYDQYGEEQ